MATFYTRPEIAQQTVEALDPNRALERQLSIRGMYQQQRARDQQLKAGDIQLQEAQQQQQDQQAFRQAMTDPSFQGLTIGQIAEKLAQSGKLSQRAYQEALKSDVEHRKDMAGITDAELKNQKANHDAVYGLFKSVMQLPDDQVAQNWAQIAQQYNAIPGNEGSPLDPNQPLSKQQLAQFGPMLSLGSAYLDDELKRRTALVEAKTKEAQLPGVEAESRKKQIESAFDQQYGGMTQQMADSKYRFLQEKIAAGRSIAPDDKNFVKAYEKQKLLVPQTTASIRLEGYERSRQLPVFDKKMNQTRYVSAEEMNRAATEEPGRYSVAAYTPEAVGAKESTRYFVSGKGGQQLTAFNTAIKHLDTLDRLAADLNNTSIQIVNKAKQAWAKETGLPAPANFEAAKNAMAGEVAAALKASGATDEEIAKVDETFSKAQSPDQLKGAIGTYRELLKSKKDSLEGQYKEGMTGKPNFNPDNNQSQGGDFFKNLGGKKK